MAKDNAIEFTENKYATRKEMSNDLYIQVPEDMWRKVIDYRKTFYNPLTIKNYNDQDLYICLYPTFSAKNNQIGTKLVRLLKDYNSLSETNREKEHYELSLASQCLYYVALNREEQIDINRIKKMIISENPYDDAEESLLNYLDAIKFIQERYVNKIDIDFLAELYSKVTGNDELTYFYRDSDLNDNDSKALIGRFYSFAPHQKIEQMMEDLFAFIENSTLSDINKAIITYFYVLFVKPFKDFNDEIAALLAKSVIAHNSSFGGLGALLPFENLQGEKKDGLRRLFQEITITSDITYFVSPATFIFDKNVDAAIDMLRDYSLDDLRHDFYQEDKEEPVQQKEEPKVEPVKKEVEKVQEDKIERVELFPEAEEVKEEPQKETMVKEEPKVEKVVEKPVEKIETKPEPIKENKVQKEEVVIEEEDEDEFEQEKNDELAFSFIPEKVDEAKAKRLEEHLLELDTRLSKKQAYFYARHCTLGKYYSIEQYKKCCKCVYETARKGMEELTIFGYYKKIKVRKKFLYTPVRK